MPWIVRFDDAFEREFMDLPRPVQDALLASVRLLGEYGPSLARPHVDTLNGSAYANMKELRISAANGAWRVAFAFDPEREGILLVAGDKSGVASGRFYRRLIATADSRYAAHQQRLGRLPARKE